MSYICTSYSFYVELNLLKVLYIKKKSGKRFQVLSHVSIWAAHFQVDCRLNSCLGKLFCTILFNRLAPIFEQEKIYCKEQGGFRKKHRTTDHIFILRKIIRQYTMQSKILYTCFVDFQKAFDSVWRKALVQKLEQINGHFLQII